MSSFPQELPPRPGAAGGGGAGAGGSWKDRNCPNMRTCWAFSWSAYGLATSDKAQLCRRLCMWAILLVRTAMSVWGIVRDALGGRIVSVIIFSILGVLGFFFIAWCLAQIGEARGRRKVLGVMVGRWHFDIFLAVFAVIHVGLLVGAAFSQFGLGISWLIMWGGHLCGCLGCHLAARAR
ncbi:hypothetical protein PG999_003855 [Apiospora kogelbergensis]|uniref:Uncharacterized protein n=1 Tax=Apiospora kogelbergensis TaxID=1337665 RepID=A0AAW0R4T3_9PEZI